MSILSKIIFDNNSCYIHIKLQLQFISINIQKVFTINHTSTTNNALALYLFIDFLVVILKLIEIGYAL